MLYSCTRRMATVGVKGSKSPFHYVRAGLAWASLCDRVTADAVQRYS